MSYDSMKHYGESVRRNNAIAEAEEKLKPYGWGIVDKDGKPFDSCNTEGWAKVSAAEMDEFFPTSAPHRVVQLFYKEEE